MQKILVVDDDLAIRNITYDLLTSKGFQVETVSRGDQALAMLFTEKPDLVLLDLKIPGEDGLSLLKKIRVKDPKLPVVIFSGHVSSDIEVEAFEAGAVEVLSKGLGIEALGEKIKKILEAKAKIMGPAPKKRSEKILIVDDEEPIRTFLSEFFKRKGFETIQAARGEEAIALVQKERPSIILLDITMPGMDGILTLKKIREFDQEVGVVMATSVQDEEIAAEAARLGSYHYVLKPFDLQYLELVVTTRLLIAS